MTAATDSLTPDDQELVAARMANAARELWDCWTRPDDLRRSLLGPHGWAMPTFELEPQAQRARQFHQAEALELSGERRSDEYTMTLDTLILAHGSSAPIPETASSESRARALATGMKEAWAASHCTLDR